LYAGFTGDISRTGALLYSIHDMPIGAELRITFFYPDQYRLNSLELRGRIVRKDIQYIRHSKKYGYGVKFTPITAAHREKLEFILRQALPIDSGSLPWQETFSKHFAYYDPIP